MIRFKTSRIWKGERVKAKDPVTDATQKEIDAGLECGQFYDDNVEAEPKPTMDNTKAEIIEYLNAHYIEHSDSMTKAELLELC